MPTGAASDVVVAAGTVRSDPATSAAQFDPASVSARDSRDDGAGAAVRRGSRRLGTPRRARPGLLRVRAQPGGDLLVTLLRCVGQLSRDDVPTRPGHAGWPMATPLAQCLGRERIQLALCPVTPATSQSRARRTGRRSGRTCSFHRGPSGCARPSPLTVRLSWTLGSRARGSSSRRCKPAEATANGIVFRCYNDAERPTAGRWRSRRCDPRCVPGPRRRAGRQTPHRGGRRDRNPVRRGPARDRHLPRAPAGIQGAPSNLFPHARFPGAAVLPLSPSIRVLRLWRHSRRGRGRGHRRGPTAARRSIGRAGASGARGCVEVAVSSSATTSAPSTHSHTIRPSAAAFPGPTRRPADRTSTTAPSAPSSCPSRAGPDHPSRLIEGVLVCLSTAPFARSAARRCGLVSMATGAPAPGRSRAGASPQASALDTAGRRPQRPARGPSANTRTAPMDVARVRSARHASPGQTDLARLKTGHGGGAVLVGLHPG